MKKLLTSCLTLALGASISLQAKDPQVQPYAGSPGWKETKTERTKWFKDGKFGMFIHWGLYSPAGGYWPPTNGKKYPQHYSEWIRYWGNVSEPEYGNLTKPLFTPAKGCTDQWAQVAKDAGMKYTVLTTKHHDGYTLFNAKAPYSVKNDITGSTNISPKGRDMVAEYANSVRKQGLKVGYYYSLIDWQHPHAVPQSRPWPLAKNADHNKYVDYMHSHMKQLFSDYGKSDMIWLDYSSAQYQGSSWKTRSLLDALHKLQPQALTNNRFWNGLQNGNGDFFTPEKYVPATGFPGRTFEVCHTMNESFGYSHHDKKWKSTKETLDLLIDIVSKGGNLLLNVGPDANGRIPQECVNRLQEVGQWLEVYGGSIYGTQASPFAKLPRSLRCTQKALKNGNTRLYFHILKWPKNGQLTLPALENKVVKSYLIGSKKEINTPNLKANVPVTLPANAVNTHSSVLVLEIEGKVKVNALMSMPQQGSDRSVNFVADDAKLSGPNLKLETSYVHKDYSNLGYWTNTQAAAVFSANIHTPGKAQAGGVVTRKPGRYSVYLEYATANGCGGDLLLTTVKNQKVKAQIKATGGWSNYKRIKIGEIVLKKAGKTDFKLQATKINGGGFMNVKALELSPID